MTLRRFPEPGISPQGYWPRRALSPRTPGGRPPRGSVPLRGTALSLNRSTLPPEHRLRLNRYNPLCATRSAAVTASASTGAAGHDQGHRARGGCLEGRGLVRAQRPPRARRHDARARSSGSRTSSAGARIAPRARSRRRARTRAGSCSHGRHGRSRSRASSPSSSQASSPSFRARSIALTLQLATDVESEVEVYRRWWAEHRVDGVLLLDLREDDPRIDALAELGLPAVVVGGPVDDGVSPSVWHDERAAVVELVRYLAALGHERDRARGRRGRLRPQRRPAPTAFEEAAASSGSRRASSRPTTRRRAARARPASSSPIPSRPRRSRSTATSSPSRGSAPRSRWASRSPTTSRSSRGTTRSSARSSTHRSRR